MSQKRKVLLVKTFDSAQTSDAAMLDSAKVASSPLVASDVARACGERPWARKPKALASPSSPTEMPPWTDEEEVDELPEPNALPRRRGRPRGSVGVEMEQGAAAACGSASKVAASNVAPDDAASTVAASNVAASNVAPDDPEVKSMIPTPPSPPSPTHTPQTPGLYPSTPPPHPGIRRGAHPKPPTMLPPPPPPRDLRGDLRQPSHQPLHPPTRSQIFDGMTVMAEQGKERKIQKP